MASGPKPLRPPLQGAPSGATPCRVCPSPGEPVSKPTRPQRSRIGEEAVLGANVVITASTKIIDVTGAEPVEMKGYVPPRSVVIPGTRTKKFPAGEYQIPVALIIGKRKASTDKKVTLNDALRDFGVSV